MRRLAALALAVASCGAPGTAGHARRYAPTAAELFALRGSEEFDTVMAHRDPAAWRRKKVHLFGVVLAREDGRRPGRAYLTLSLRVLEEQNLCSRADEGSCRTTVSELEHGRLHALVTLVTEEDERGASAVGAGSLIRLVGSLAEGVDADDGELVLDALAYRHFPRGEWVHAGEREKMGRR